MPKPQILNPKPESLGVAIHFKGIIGVLEGGVENKRTMG